MPLPPVNIQPRNLHQMPPLLTLIPMWQIIHTLLLFSSIIEGRGVGLEERNIGSNGRGLGREGFGPGSEGRHIDHEGGNIGTDIASQTDIGIADSVNSQAHVGNSLTDSNATWSIRTGGETWTRDETNVQDNNNGDHYPHNNQYNFSINTNNNSNTSEHLRNSSSSSSQTNTTKLDLNETQDMESKGRKGRQSYVIILLSGLVCLAILFALFGLFKKADAHHTKQDDDGGDAFVLGGGDAAAYGAGFGPL